MPVELEPRDQQLLDSLLEMKVIWSTQIFPRLWDDFHDAARQAGGQPQNAAEAEQLVANLPLYTLYATLEREIQREKYAVLLPAIKRKEGDLVRELKDGADAGGHLELDATLELPRYYTSVDFHQHPGGVWSDDIDGYVYEYAARSTNPTFTNNEAIFRQLADSLSDRGAGRILDMGCGFGKTTAPLAEVFPDAEIHGIDLAAPCLKLASLRARQRGLAVTYSQQNAEATRFKNEYFDVVTAHQLLHEVPRAALRNILSEAFRVLRPGGHFMVLDFHTPGGPFETFIHYGHAERNNEVFMRLFAETDILGELAAAGFVNAGMQPFGGQLGRGTGSEGARPREWRFPWKLISATKPA